MKIIFSSVSSGLGNNGGSQSVIRMALALRTLGHECYIISHMRNCFTWFKTPKDLNIIVPQNPSNWPQADVIIATACNTWEDVVKYNKTDKKFYWIRGHEIWKKSENQLSKGYKSGLNLLVNSEWLKKYIEETCNVETKILYSGIPFTQLEYIAMKAGEHISNKITLGCLKQKKPTKHWDHYEFIIKTFGNEFNYYAFGLDDCSNKEVRYFKNPSLVEKFKMYNTIDILIATTELEGFSHILSEATIGGCALVCNNSPRSGTDCTIHGNTALVYDVLDEAVKNIRKLADNKNLRKELNINMLTFLKYKIGSVERNAKRLIKLIS